MKGFNILFVSIAALSLFGCSEKKAERSDAPIPVKTVTAGGSVASGGGVYVGTVEESTGSTLSFEINGNVKDILVDVGDKVKKGQLIARIDQTTLRDLHNSQLAQLKQARDAYDRYKKLHDAGSLPDIKWVEVETKLEQAISSESMAREQLGKCNLYAPCSGVISERYVEPGMNVMPGGGVVKLVTVDKVKVKIAVPEKEISGMEVGRGATVTVAALDGRAYQTRVTEKGVAANRLSHTYEVKCEVDNPGWLLLPGMVCNVSVAPTGSVDSVIIPSGAVQIDTDGSRFVWVVADGAATKRGVRTGALSESGVAIEEGVSAGDKVIVDGAQKVSEGMKVVEQ